MDIKEKNQKALACLASQNWERAQRLFFANAKQYPCHETYNNLGVFLIHEGLTCQNGKSRSAKKLGMKYLLRAADMKTTPVNLCAIAKAFDFKSRNMDKAEKEQLFRKMYQLLVTAYRIVPTNETQYNILRLRILTKEYNTTLLEETKNLLTAFECEESVRLYFETLRLFSVFDEGVCCIDQYGRYLAEDDILLFYAKHEKYDYGYRLCKTVFSQYSLNKYIAAAIIECCANTNHAEEACFYAQHVVAIKDKVHAHKADWIELVVSNPDRSEVYRKKLISEYLSIPPFVDSCCYFGCREHNCIEVD